MIKERHEIVDGELTDNFKKLKINTDGPIKLPHNELKISSPKRTLLEKELEQFTNINISLIDESKLGCLKYCSTLEDLELEKTKELTNLSEKLCCWFCTRSRKKWKNYQPLTIPIKYVESYYLDHTVEVNSKKDPMEEVKMEECDNKPKEAKIKSIKKLLSKNETLIFLRNIIKNDMLLSSNNNSNTTSLQSVQQNIGNNEKELYNTLRKWEKEQIIKYIEDKPHLVRNLKIRDYFVGIGIVCSFPCMTAYLNLHSKNILYKETSYLMRKLYNLFFPPINFAMVITPSPDPHCLQKFGGEVSDEEYGKMLTNCEQIQILKMGLCDSTFKTRMLKDVYLIFGTISDRLMNSD